MFEGFSPEVVVVMNVARALRDVSAAPYVGTHHVLLAFTCGPSHAVAGVLEVHGISQGAVSATLREHPELDESRPGTAQRREGKGPSHSSWLVEILRRSFVAAGDASGTREDVSAPALASLLVNETQCSASKLLSLLDVDIRRLGAELARASSH